MLAQGQVWSITAKKSPVDKVPAMWWNGGAAVMVHHHSHIRRIDWCTISTSNHRASLALNDPEEKRKPRSEMTMACWRVCFQNGLNSNCPSPRWISNLGSGMANQICNPECARQILSSARNDDKPPMKWSYVLHCTEAYGCDVGCCSGVHHAVDRGLH